MDGGTGAVPTEADATNILQPKGLARDLIYLPSLTNRLMPSMGSGSLR